MQWTLPLCFVLILCPTVFDPMDCSTKAPLSSTISQSLIKFMSIESVMLSNHLILCHLLHLLLSTFPRIWVFYNQSALCNRWPKYWRFSISPSSPSGLVSFRIDWFDLPAVQGTLKSLLQHHSSKASIFWCSAFFMVQLSHLYVNTGKIIAMAIWIFVSKVMPLVFNMLCRFYIAFSSREQESFNPMAAVIVCSDFGAKKRKSVTVSTFSFSICHEVMGPHAITLLLMLRFKPAFSLSFFIIIKRLFRSSLFTFHY